MSIPALEVKERRLTDGAFDFRGSEFKTEPAEWEKETRRGMPGSSFR